MARLSFCICHALIHAWSRIDFAVAVSRHETPLAKLSLLYCFCYLCIYSLSFPLPLHLTAMLEYVANIAFNRVVKVGGEPFKKKHLSLLPHCKSIRNVYGPTECTIWSSCCMLLASDLESLQTIGVPLGQPIGEVCITLALLPRKLQHC